MRRPSGLRVGDYEGRQSRVKRGFVSDNSSASATIQAVRVIYTYDEGWWTAEAPFLAGAYGQGRTRESALKNLQGAISDLLEAYGKRGEQPPFNSRT